RQGVRLRRLHVQEMDPLTVDLGRELRVRVELRLRGPPVVLGPPVLDQLGQPGDRYAGVPVVTGQRRGQTGAGQLGRQVVEGALRDVDAEWLDHASTLSP